jgi:hypothetical protein
VVAGSHRAEIEVGMDRDRNAGRLEGRYANYFKVGHNAFEFVLDLGQYYPENETEYFHTRIITGPIYAKSLLNILRESILEYERTYGSIPQADEGGAHGD